MRRPRRSCRSAVGSLLPWELALLGCRFTLLLLGTAFHWFSRPLDSRLGFGRFPRLAFSSPLGRRGISSRDGHAVGFFRVTEIRGQKSRAPDVCHFAE